MMYNISSRCTAWWFDICIHCEVVIAVGLVNTHHHTDWQFFSAMRPFKIYPLCNFRAHSTVFLLRVAALCLTPRDLFLWNWTLYLWPLRPSHPCPLPISGLFSASMSSNGVFFLDSTYHCLGCKHKENTLSYKHPREARKGRFCPLYI